MIPPLSDEERTTLESSIKQDDFRDPIVVWDGVLIDGHNRFDIYNNTDDIDPPIITEMEFPNRSAAKDWMIHNQLGRRNLTHAQRIRLSLLLEPVVAEQAKEQRKESGKTHGKGQNLLTQEKSSPRPQE